MQHLFVYVKTMTTPVLQTDRLILRPVSIKDAPAIQKYFNNWNIIRNLSDVVPWPYPEDGAETFLRDIALPKVGQGKAHIWAIIPREGPEEAIGLVDVRLEENPENGHRGFWLAEPFWGRGYMTEAVTTVQDFLFFELEIERIVVMNAASNSGSRRVKEKTGARFLEIVALKHHSGTCDTEKWEVTRESWAGVRNRPI